ncbi:MAG: hypothetical protein AB7F59_14675 [Bdellovibrionales bacterium]
MPAKKSPSKTPSKLATKETPKKAVAAKKPIEKKATEKKPVEKKAVDKKVAEKKTVAKPAPASAKEVKAPKVSPSTLKGKTTAEDAPVKVPKVPKVKKTKEEKKAEKAAAKEALQLENANADWLELHKQFKNMKPMPYAMSEQYPEKCVINHKVLGVGFVVKNINDRIDVVFKDGQKTLITNYKK